MYTYSFRINSMFYLNRLQKEKNLQKLNKLKEKKYAYTNVYICSNAILRQIASNTHIMNTVYRLMVIFFILVKYMHYDYILALVDIIDTYALNLKLYNDVQYVFAF